MSRKIYHLEFAKTGLWVSGWETCMVEIVRYFSSIGEKNVIFTTDNGRVVYEELWLLEWDNISYKIINSYDDEKKYHMFFAYLKRLPKIRTLLKTISFWKNDVVFCHSDFFPNTIPLFLIYLKYRFVDFVYLYHTKAPRLFYGFKWEFLNKLHVPSLSFIHYKLNQELYLFLINLINRWLIIWVNPYYQNFLNKKLKTTIQKHYLKIFGWVWDFSIDKNVCKIYDWAWMGRFQDLKWIEELFWIVSQLKKINNNIKILVIGGWTKESEFEFIKNIKRYWLEDNIDYKWFLKWKERFEELSQAKIFLMTSYFEWRPIVMLELLKLWIPIVAYDLPVYWVYNKGVKKVSILNNDQFSKEVCRLLENEALYNKLSIEAKDFSKEYSWENTGKEIYNLLK